MYFPSRSITLTGILTSVVSTLTTSPSPTSSGPASFCRTSGFCSFGSRVAPPRTGGRIGPLGSVESEAGGGAGWVEGEDCWGGGIDPTRRGRDWALAVCAIARVKKQNKTRAVNFFMMELLSERRLTLKTSPAR